MSLFYYRSDFLLGVIKRQYRFASTSYSVFGRLAGQLICSQNVMHEAWGGLSPELKNQLSSDLQSCKWRFDFSALRAPSTLSDHFRTRSSMQQARLTSHYKISGINKSLTAHSLLSQGSNIRKFSDKFEMSRSSGSREFMSCLCFMTVLVQFPSTEHKIWMKADCLSRADVGWLINIGFFSVLNVLIAQFIRKAIFNWKSATGSPSKTSWRRLVWNKSTVNGFSCHENRVNYWKHSICTRYCDRKKRSRFEMLRFIFISLFTTNLLRLKKWKTH